MYNRFPKIKTMRVHVIHSRFKFYFDGYENKDLAKICKKLCNTLKLKGNNYYDLVIKHWSLVCQFLINWTGKTNFR